MFKERRLRDAFGMAQTIVFEGADGSGKTTQLNMLSEYLSKCNQRWFAPRDPGSTMIGEQIRTIVKTHDDKREPMSHATEMLLFLAARRQLVEIVLKPKRSQVDAILLDRFADSTAVYQYRIHSCPIPQHQFDTLSSFGSGGFEPEVTLFFDVNPDVALDRRKKRDESVHDRFDAGSINWYRKVTCAYRDQYEFRKSRTDALDNPTSIVMRIDANLSEEKVHQQVVETLDWVFEYWYRANGIERLTDR